MLIQAMHTTQLGQADLNLLVVFKVLAEERNVSRAARRLLLTQPAATRALGRLREMFSDDLLVRVSGSYELTPKGQLLLRELEAALPRIGNCSQVPTSCLLGRPCTSDWRGPTMLRISSASANEQRCGSHLAAQ